MKKTPDALTHPDAFLYRAPMRMRAHPHIKPFYKEVRQGASVRQEGRLNDLANAVQRLTIDRRDPEKFHMDKSEIVAALRRMARTTKP
jgi:hypothetical protein